MREFTIPMVASTLAGSTSGAVTLIFANPAAAPSVNLEFLRFSIGQSANATSAQQRVQLVTQVTAFPTLTAVTPVKTKKSDPNASVITGNTTGAAGTCGVNASAEGGGAKTVGYEDTFNVLNGWLYVPTPPELVVMPAGFASGLGVYFPSAPGTATSWSATATYRET